MKPPSEENPLEREDPLWEVLGRARPPAEPDPWFTQKVMRDLPPQESTGGWRERLGSWWTASRPRLWVPVAAAFAVALGVLQFTGPKPVEDDDDLAWNPPPVTVAPENTARPKAVAPVTPALDPLVASAPLRVPAEDPQVDAVLEDLDALLAFEEPATLEEPLL